MSYIPSITITKPQAGTLLSVGIKKRNKRCPILIYPERSNTLTQREKQTAIEDITHLSSLIRETNLLDQTPEDKKNNIIDTIKYRTPYPWLPCIKKEAIIKLPYQIIQFTNTEVLQDEKGCAETIKNKPKKHFKVEADKEKYTQYVEQQFDEISKKINEKQEPAVHKFVLTDHQLGEGGYGKVKLAFDIILNKPIAVKVESKTSLSVYNEYKILKKLNAYTHFRILRENDTTCSFLLFVDLMDTDLKEYIHTNPEVTNETITRCLTEINSSMEYIHSKGIIHRDIKPSNILIPTDYNSQNSSKKVKIGDFGDAIEVGVPQEKKYHGTFNYMPYEVLVDQEYSTYSDIFSFGVVVQELLFPNRQKQLCIELYTDHIAPILPENLQKILRTARKSKIDKLTTNQCVLHTDTENDTHIDSLIAKQHTFTCKNPKNRYQEDNNLYLNPNLLKIAKGCLKRIPEARMKTHEIQALLRGEIATGRTR